MLIQPYLFFGGRCEEALNFYRDALGAEIVMLMRFDQSPQPVPPGQLPAGFEKKVMHSSFRIGGQTLMASDGCGGVPSHDGCSLAISVPSVAEAEKTFAALSKGGKVTMPLAKTFWSPAYGQLVDAFGVEWMVMATES